MHRAAAVVLALWAGAAAAQLTAASLAHTVDEHYNHLHSLQCRYTERYQGLGLDRSETGTLTLQKPGRMRWAYDTPAGKLFLLDGHSAISYTPGDAQATRLPARQLDDLRSPLRLLLGHTELNRELDHLTLTLATDSPRTYTLRGVPKTSIPAAGQPLRSVSLTVDAAGQILAMRIDQADGSATTFTFTQMRENLPIPPSDFTFTPPPGVTVINGTAPI